ncbi:MAG: hypothetical protein IKZ99_04315 [Salinivirgaceae bacterium]|nr:hypothetical protein [Salinivirgaceae bacterium]
MRRIKLLSVALLGVVLFGGCSSKEHYLEQACKQQIIKISSLESQVINLGLPNGLRDDEGIIIAYNVNKEPAFSSARDNGRLNLWNQSSILANKYWENNGKEYYPVINVSDISIPAGDDDGLVISLFDGEGNVYAKECNKTQGIFGFQGKSQFAAGLGIRLENTNSFAAINVAVEAVFIKCKYE